MKSIFVGFSKSKKFLPIGSWLIQLYQRTKFSHVYIKLETPEFPSNTYLHASEGKVLQMSGTEFKKRHEVLEEFEIVVPDAVHKLVMDEIHEKSGADYSVLQNVGILYVDLMRELFGKRVFNPLSSGWNCSEYVAYILNIVNPQIYEYTDINSVTPKDLYVQLNKLME